MIGKNEMGDLFLQKGKKKPVKTNSPICFYYTGVRFFCQGYGAQK